MRAAATWVGVMVLWLAPAAFSDGSPEPAEDEPVLEGEAKQKHEKEVKEILGRLNSAKNRESVVGDIKILGAQKTRAARDALMAFATGNKNHDYVKHAFEALAKIGTKRGVAFLCGKDGLRSGNYLVQHSALEALGVMKHPASVGPLLDVLTDKASKIEIMGAAAKAVARTAPTDERVAETLFLLCDHKKDTIRSNALEALGYLGTDKAMARLVDAMKNDKNTRARGAAATGLKNSGRKDQIPVLREAIAGENALPAKELMQGAIRALEEGA